MYHCLTPRWNETFVFTAPKAEAHQRKRRVHVTVKDNNKHLSDDTLGEVSVVRTLRSTAMTTPPPIVPLLGKPVLQEYSLASDTPRSLHAASSVL